MSANYRTGPAWILSAPTIDTPLAEWTLLSKTREGVVVRTSSGFISVGKSDQIGETPLASSVRKVGSQIESIESTFLNIDIDEIQKAIPGSVKVTNATEEAIGISQLGSTLTPLAFAVVPVNDYNEDVPGDWFDSLNYWIIEKGLLEITGETTFRLDTGEDNLSGYQVSIAPFSNVGSKFMGGRGLYRFFTQYFLTVGTNPFSVSYNNDGTKIVVANYGSNNIMIVDASTGAIEDTITVGTQPRSAYYNNDGTKIVVANYGSNNITNIVGL